MKKAILLFSTFLLFACSGSDDGSSVKTTTFFHPPVWIQGTWGITSGGTPQKFYRFSKDNVCQLITNISENCWREQMQLLEDNNVNYSVTDEPTETTYTCGFINNGSSIKLRFKKISDTKILWIDNSTELVKM